jgi:hypothetical protein
VSAPLFAVDEGLEVLLAVDGVPLAVVSIPVKSTVRLDTGNDCEVSVRVIPLPLTQKLEIPGAPTVNVTPAHYY